MMQWNLNFAHFLIYMKSLGFLNKSTWRICPKFMYFRLRFVELGFFFVGLAWFYPSTFTSSSPSPLPSLCMSYFFVFSNQMWAHCAILCANQRLLSHLRVAHPRRGSLIKLGSVLTHLCPPGEQPSAEPGYEQTKPPLACNALIRHTCISAQLQETSCQEGQWWCD